MFCKNYFALLLCVLFMNTLYSAAQIPDYPVEGEPCPEFSIGSVEHYKERSVSLASFRGKWLILYFWTTGCSAGVGGFRIMNEIQAKFKDQLQVLLVAKNDERNWNIRNVYEKFRKQYNYDMAVAYDTELFARFVGRASIPHIVIIRPDGKVHAVTELIDVTPDGIRDLLSGKPVQFIHKSNEYNVELHPAFYLYKPMLIDGNGGEETDFLFRSLLGKWNNESGISFTSSLKEQVSKGQFQAKGLSILDLYKFAYIGQTVWGIRDSLYGIFANEVALEVANPGPFSADWKSGTGRYNYSLIVPKEKATEEYVQKVMRRDLKNYFGYDVNIEKRMVPYWKLVVKDPGKIRFAPLRVKDSTYVDHATLRIFSGKMQQLLWTIYFYHQTKVLIDSTGIKENIQIHIDGDLSNYEHLLREIRKNGLDVQQGQMEMSVLVIRDPA